MGRAPCCDKANVKRGPWSPEEDAKLKDYIHSHGTGGNWIALPHKAGLKRCGKSCRLRWLNYLRPNIKHGEFSDQEDTIICTLFATIGSRWSIIAAQLPGRTDNDIKNYWNTKLKKKLMGMANNINPNPQVGLSHHTFKPNNSTSFHPAVAVVIPHNHSPSPDSSLLLSPDSLSSSPLNTTSNGPIYSNAPSSSALIPLTGFDLAGFFINSPNGMSPSAPTILPQEGYFCPSPMHTNYMVFGSAPETSCSSSDGNDLHLHYQYQDQPQQFHGCPPYSSSMGLGETEAALMMGYGLEEIKQLISTSTSQNGDCSNSNCFCFDDNKTGEGVMMYY